MYIQYTTTINEWTIKMEPNELVKTAIHSLQSKFGELEIFHKNNQHAAVLFDGRRAIIKTGSKGQVMQRTHGTGADARYTGVEDADLVVISVRDGPKDAIRVYAVDGAIYRDRMTKTHMELQTSGTLDPTDLRVLRFDGKGYPEQRVDEDWADYMLSADPDPVVALSSEGSSDLSPSDAIQQAKYLVANAFGIPAEKVNISVDL